MKKALAFLAVFAFLFVFSQEQSLSEEVFSPSSASQTEQVNPAVQSDGSLGSASETAAIPAQTAIVDDSFSGMHLIMYQVSIPAGMYHLSIDAISSSDTDSSSSRLTFIGLSDSDIVMDIKLQRNTPISTDIQLLSDVTYIYLYAGDSYSHSKNDTFTFSGFRLTAKSSMTQSVSSCTQDVITYHRNAFTNGIMFSWNADNSSCIVSGQKTASDRQTSLTLINTFHDDPLGSPNGLQAGELYHVQFSSSDASVGLAAYIFTNGNTDTAKPDSTLQFSENGMLNLPADATDVIVRIEVSSSSHLDASFSAHIYADRVVNTSAGAVSAPPAETNQTVQSSVNTVETAAAPLPSPAGTVSSSATLERKEVLNETYAGTATVAVPASLPSGTYKIKIGSVVSSDTDDATSMICFANGETVVQSIWVNRDVPVETEVTLDSPADSVLLYAADNYKRSDGDAFTFNSLIIETSSELLSKVDHAVERLDAYVPYDLVTNHMNANSNGIKFQWNADFSECTVTGKKAGSSFINLLFGDINTLSGISAGKNYYVEYASTTPQIRLTYSYWADGKDSNEAPDHWERIEDNTIVSLPENATAVRFRVDIPSDKEVNGRFTAHVFANGFPAAVLSDEIAKLSDPSSEAVSNADPDDLLPEKGTETVAGITFTLIEKGHYIVSGTAEKDNKWIDIVSSVTEMPAGFAPGGTYYLRYFADDPRMCACVYAYDSAQNETQLVSTRHMDNLCTDFTIPADAVGLVVRLKNYFADYTYLNSHLEIAIFDVNSPRISEIRSYNWAPRPMLTIIDDDGNIGFKRDLLPIIESRNTTISSSVPALYPALREITEQYLDAQQKLKQGKMKKAEFNAIKEKFEALRAEVGRSDYDEDYFMNTMSWAEVLECREKGADILCHTYTHMINQDELSEEVLQRQYKQAQAIFEHHGIPADILVYAGDTGSHPNVRRACSRVFDYGIYSSSDRINYVGDDPYDIKRFGIGPDEEITWDMDNIKAHLDALAMSKTGWMVWTIHTSNATWTSESAEIIAAAIDYAQSLHLPVVSALTGAKAYYGNVHKPYNPSGFVRYE